MAFCKQLQGSIKRLHTLLDERIASLLPKIILTLDVIKRIVESPTLKAITDFTPTTIDNKLRDAIDLAIDVALPQLIIIEECQNKTGTELRECFILMVKTLPESVREAVYSKLASLILKILHNGKLKQNAYDYFTQAGYSTQLLISQPLK